MEGTGAGTGRALNSQALSRMNGAKVFSATMAQQRHDLGDRITEWIRSNPQCEILDTVVTQSSDESFHCLAVTLFFYEPNGKSGNGRRRH